MTCKSVIEKFCLLLSVAIGSCTTNTNHAPNQSDTTVKVAHVAGNSDSIYRVGDILFEGSKGLVFDYFPTNNPPEIIKSKGDTIYRDNDVTLLADNKKAGYPIFKKYKIKYRFDSFAVPEIYTGSFVPPRFSTDPAARYFRTVIRKDCAKDTINFSGHYTIAEWGCGAQCGLMAVVNRKNGHVFFSNKYIPFDTVDGHYGIEYRRDSRLIIVNSELLNFQPGYIMLSWAQVGYYIWNGHRFEKLD